MPRGVLKICFGKDIFSSNRRPHIGVNTPFFDTLEFSLFCGMGND